LARDLASNGLEVIATDLEIAAPVSGASVSRPADLRDPEAIAGLVARYRPHRCIHLGAVSFVPTAEADPAAVLCVNIAGTIAVLDAFRSRAPEARILVVSTAHVYGAGGADVPLTEDSPLLPVGMYAVSKAAADLAALSYAKHYGLQVLTARPCNHTGPGQSPRFAVPSFVAQLRAIRHGDSPPVLRVGNLESRRDFADVRDVAGAYRLLLEHGKPGNAYNISSQRLRTIGEILDMLCDLAGTHPERVTDPAKFRPTDCSPQLDLSRLRQDTGWKPEISMEQTLKDMLQQ
jgi:GDP-4-dehydro-6-deoxy-D-mannose reductase